MNKPDTENCGFYIHAYMADMGLSGNELMVYAIVYAFTQGKNKLFWGAKKYISALIGISDKTTYRTIDKLIADGYVERASYNGRKGIRTTGKLEKMRQDKAVEKAFKELEEEGRDKIFPSQVIPKVKTKPKDISDIDDIFEESPYDSLVPDELDLYDIDPNVEPKYKVVQLGRDKLVSMTKEQYQALMYLAPAHIVDGYINKLDHMHCHTLYTGEGFIEQSSYKTIKKWIKEDYGV